jgi:hypothetical protein
MLSKALNLVRQVEAPTGNSPTDAQKINLLTQAITEAQQAPNHRLTRKGLSPPLPSIRG